MGMKIGEKEIRQTLSFISEWIEHQLKESEIKKWDEKTKKMLFEAIIEPSRWFVKAIAVGNETFDRIHGLVKKSFENKKIQKELIEIYKKQKEESLCLIDQLIETYEVRAFGSDKAQQLRTLRERPEMQETLQKVEQSARQAARVRPNRKKALEIHDRLLGVRAWVEIRNFPFSEADFSRKTDEKAPILEISYKIWKPNFLHPIYQYEDDYQNFPLRGLGINLTVWTHEYFYIKWKTSGDLTEIISSFYDGEDAFETMKKKCGSNPFGFRRTPLLEEIIGNYKDGRFASVITLALTQIEGVIWDLSIILHNLGVERIFEQNKINVQDYRRSKLIDEEGKIIEAEPTIGLLVRCTRMKEYLHADFLDYYTIELFEERNPILHGRITNFGSKLEANKKILALEMVISALHGILVSKSDIYLRHILGAQFEEFQKSLHTGDAKEAFQLLKKALKTKRESKTNG